MPLPVHRDQARKFVIGVVTIAILGVVAYVGILVQGGGELPGKSYTYVTAKFHDVGMLRPQQDVELGGVRIGQVDSVAYRNGHAVVTMRLDGEQAVYRDARARVTNESLLGRETVMLDLGTPASGPLGARPIPLSRTRDSAVLDDALSVFDVRTRKALSSSLIELGSGLGGHSDDLRDAVQAAPALLDNVGEITGALASERADLPSLLTSANRLMARFEGRQREVTSLIEQMDATFRAINVDRAKPLSDTVESLPATLRQARQGLQTLNAPLDDARAAVTIVRPGGQALGHSTSDLRGLLREGVGPLRKVTRVSRAANPAVEDLTHTVVDASPLVPRVSRTVGDASVLLHDLAPYATDIGRFFSEHDLLSGQFAPDKHYFSAMLVMPGLYTASLDDPTAETIPYPEPGGGAWRDNPAGGGQG